MIERIIDMERLEWSPSGVIQFSPETGYQFAFETDDDIATGLHELHTYRQAVADNIVRLHQVSEEGAEAIARLEKEHSEPIEQIRLANASMLELLESMITQVEDALEQQDET